MAEMTKTEWFERAREMVATPDGKLYLACSGVNRRCIPVPTIFSCGHALMESVADSEHPCQTRRSDSRKSKNVHSHRKTIP
jgi:hypothetical protein